MGDLILTVGMIVALLSCVGSFAAGVWYLITLHWWLMVPCFSGACILAAQVVAFSRAQRVRRD